MISGAGPPLEKTSIAPAKVPFSIREDAELDKPPTAVHNPPHDQQRLL